MFSTDMDVTFFWHYSTQAFRLAELRLDLQIFVYINGKHLVFLRGGIEQTFLLCTSLSVIKLR